MLPRWDRLIALAEALDVMPGTLLLQTGLITIAHLQDAAKAAGQPTPAVDVPAEDAGHPH